MAALTRIIRELAHDEGFDRVGLAPAQPVDRAEYVRRWLEQGQAGEMRYLHNYLDKRLDPRKLLPDAASVVVLAMNYYQDQAPPQDHQARGRVARYAWGKDYHTVIKKKLWRIIDALRARLDIPFEAKPCVDTSPILEREWAMQAGVGWIGKNTLVLNQQLGSYFFLGEIVTTLALDYDAPSSDHCGSCTRCLEACPTQAFPAPYQMDARRCISYHTIELRSPIPQQYHESIGDWLFGCDICQEVCPFNQSPPATKEPEFSPLAPAARPLLHELLQWTPAEYRRNLKGSAMKRATLDMLQRNAGIALGNLGAAHQKGGDSAESPPAQS